MKTLSVERQKILGQKLYNLASQRLIELEIEKEKLERKIRLCHDNWKLQQYRERIVTAERSIEINKAIIGN